MSDAPIAARDRGRGLGESVARAALLIAVATLLARVIGFLRILVFSHSVGATPVGDTYQTVNTLPNVVFEVAAGGVLAAVAVPIIAGQLGAGRNAAADRSASALLTWAILVLAPLSLAVGLAAPWLSGLLLDDDQALGTVQLGAQMLVLFAPQIVLYGIGIVLTGVLHSHRRFLAAALAPLLSSLVVIAAYLAYSALADGQNTPETVPNAAVLALAGGTTLGVVVLSLPLFVPVVRAGVRLRPTLRFPSGAARRAGTLAGAGVLALAAQQAAVFTTLWLTHHRSADPGTVNVYAYVQAVYLLPYAVLAVPIATSAFPALAQEDAAAGGDAGTVPPHRTLARAAQGVLVLCGGAAAVLVAVSGPVGAFFAALDRGQGAGGTAALTAMPDALQAYAPGLVGFGVAALLTRALYVRGRPVVAALAVAAGWAVAALWPLLTLPEDAGASGTLRSLGVASTAGMTLSAVLLAVLVRRAWGASALAGSGRTMGAAVVAAALGVAAGDVVNHAWGPTDSIPASVAAGVVVALVVGLVYLAAMAVADREAVRTAVERGRRRRGRG